VLLDRERCDERGGDPIISVTRASQRRRRRIV